MIEAPEGAQSVDRACAILRELGRAGREGARMSDLSGRLGLSRPTVSRILRSLMRAGFARQDPATRRYGLGSEIFELGLIAPSPVTRLPEFHQALAGLAARTGDTANLMMRRNDDVVCVAQATGSFRIRANIVEVGSRRPLAASAAGLAILACLAPEEIEAVLARSLPGLEETTFTRASVAAHLAMAARSGFVHVVDQIMDGVSGLGAAVPGRYGQPSLGVSLSAITARLSAARLGQIRADVRRTADEIAAIATG